MKNKKEGFTLVELLVVISVIAVLLGILLPSLNRARRQGRKIVCGSRMRQISLAFDLYSADFSDWIVTAKDVRSSIDGQSAWNFELLPYICRKVRGSFDSATLWFCPEDRDPFPLGYGSYPHAVGLTSFALNGVYEPDKNIKVGPAGGYKISQISQPSQCMMMTETSYAGQIYDKESASLRADGIYLNLNGHHRRTTGFYHLSSANIIFVDGHIDSVKGKKTTALTSGVTQDWLAKNMFWPDLSFPTADEKSLFWGPGYK